MNRRGNVKFLVDIEKACLMTNFEKRNWVRGSEGVYLYTIFFKMIINIIY